MPLMRIGLSPMPICVTIALLMPLSPLVINELTQEREGLLKRRADIDARLEAIDLLVGNRNRIVVPRVVRVKVLPKSHLPLGDGDVTGAGSLRAAIRQTLSGAADMKPGDIIRSLRTHGFAIHGKTPYDTRVYNELKRMLKAGLLTRNDRGQYALPRQEGVK